MYRWRRRRRAQENKFKHNCLVTRMRATGQGSSIVTAAAADTAVAQLMILPILPKERRSAHFARCPQAYFLAGPGILRPRTETLFFALNGNIEVLLGGHHGQFSK